MHRTTRRDGRSRRAVLGGIAGAVAAGVSGCLGGGAADADSGPDRTPIEDRTLRYGGVMATSGGLGTVGKPIAAATELPADELRASSLGVEVDYAVRDSGTSARGGIDATRELVDEGYPAIVGPLASGVALQATQQAAIPAEVVTCSPSATTPTLSILNDRGFCFRTAPDDSLQAVVAARLASEEHDAASAATLYAAGDYGRQLSGAFAASFDGEVREQVSFDAGGPYEEPLATALGADADFLFVIGYPESGVDLFDLYYDRDDRAETVFVSDGLMDPSLPEAVGEPMDDVYGTAPLSDGPGREAFAAAYREAEGSDPRIFTANAYDAAAVVLLANAAAGENAGPAVRDRMADVTSEGGTEVLPGDLAEGVQTAAAGDPVRYRGASGEVTFDGNGDVTGVAYEYFAFGDGGIDVLDEVSPEVGQ